MKIENCSYQKEWDEYRRNSSLGCVIFPLLLIVTSVIIALSRHITENVLVILRVAGITAFVALIIYNLIFGQGLWKCPRCKNNFNFSKGLQSAQHCINCNLPVYYGSSYFFDHWGTERGYKEIQQVKERENQKR